MGKSLITQHKTIEHLFFVFYIRGKINNTNKNFQKILNMPRAGKNYLIVITILEM